MLEGTVPWPETLAARYRAAGHWDGSTLFSVLERSAARWPDKAALVAGDQRPAYRDLQAQALRRRRGCGRWACGRASAC